MPDMFRLFKAKFPALTLLAASALLTHGLHASNPAHADLAAADTALLERIEVASRQLTTLGCAVRIDRQEGVLGGSTRFGTLAFSARHGTGADAQPARLRIDFNARVVEGLREEMNERYVFDGRRLLVVHTADHAADLRTVRRDGEPGDALADGDLGLVLPIPFDSQRLRERFEVLLLPATMAAELHGGGDDEVWLRLVPRPTDNADERPNFDRLDLSFTAEGLLPRRAIATRMIRNDDGSVSAEVAEHTVLLLSRHDAGATFAADHFDTTPPTGPEWTVQTLED